MAARKPTSGVQVPLAVSVGAGMLDGVLLIVQAWLLALVINVVAIEGQGLNGVWPLL